MRVTLDFLLILDTAPEDFKTENANLKGKIKDLQADKKILQSDKKALQI